MKGDFNLQMKLGDAGTLNLLTAPLGLTKGDGSGITSNSNSGDDDRGNEDEDYRGSEEDDNNNIPSLESSWVSFAGQPVPVSEINVPTKTKQMMNASASLQVPDYSLYHLAMREQLMRGYVGQSQSVYNNFGLLQDESRG